MARSQRSDQQRHRRQPERNRSRSYTGEMPPGSAARAIFNFPGIALPECSREQETRQRGGGDDQRERKLENRKCSECGNRHRDCRPALQRPRRHTQQCLQDDRQHCCLQPEQQPRNERNVTECDIERRQHQHDDETRQHKKAPGQKTARHATQQPAAIGGKLHCLRPRQQHAEVECVQETLLLQPALVIDYDAMHQRDLPGRPSKGNQPDMAECAQELTIADIFEPGGCWLVHCSAPVDCTWPPTLRQASKPPSR